MRSNMSYYLVVHTGANYATEEYAAKAGTLLNIAQDVFNTEASMEALVRGAVESVHSEIEICMEDETDEPELVLKAVIDLEGSGKLEILKTKLSAVLRGHALNEWGNMKIEKKAVPQ